MRSGRGGFRGRYGCWVRFRIRDPEAERTERRTVRVRPPHFPTTSNRAPHSEPRTPEISALWAGLVPSTVHAWLGARAQLFHHPTRPSPTPPARHRMLYGPRAHKSFVLHPPPHAITCEDPHECLCASATWHICPADSAMRIHAHAMASSKFPVPRSHDPPSAFPCRFRLASRRLARRMPWPPAAEAPRAFESVAVGAVQGTAPAAPPSSGACSSAMTAAYRSASLPVLRFVRTISPNLATVSASGSFSRARTARMAERTSSL